MNGSSSNLSPGASSKASLLDELETGRLQASPAVSNTTPSSSSTSADVSPSSLTSQTPIMDDENTPLLQEPLLKHIDNKNNTTFSFHDDEHDSTTTTTTSLRPRHITTYDSDSHLAVLFTMYGSVWPRVLPYCIVSVVLTHVVFYLQKHHINNLAFPSSNGHLFMSIMVSFLVVTRANITYGRFMESREYLDVCYRCCQELIHNMCVLTMHDESEGAKLWRRQVAYKTILLLKVTMAAMDYRTSNQNTWDVLPQQETLEVLTPAVMDTNNASSPGTYPSSGGELRQRKQHPQTTSQPSQSLKSSSIPARSPQLERISQWAHGVRTVQDENLRAPIVLAYNLRECILLQRNGEYLTNAMHVNEELKILSFVSEFMTAFHGLQRLVTTPFPFPLVQMTRTFLFFWIFSLPLVLVDSMDQAVHVMVIMFFITYGFLGLEYVSIEMEDPFGEDPNDFDNVGMAQTVFEDIYIAIFKLDGTESAEKLRDKVVMHEQNGSALDSYHQNPTGTMSVR